MEYKDVTDVIAGLHSGLDWVERKITGSWVHRIFVHTARVKWYTPPILFGHSWEIDEPFRRGKTVIVRFSWSRVVALGFWGKKHYDEDHVLLEATIHGRERTHDERSAFNEATAYEERPTAVEGSSLPLRGDRPELRVRATSDAGADG